MDDRSFPEKYARSQCEFCGIVSCHVSNFQLSYPEFFLENAC